MGGCLTSSSDKKTTLDSNKCSTCRLDEFEKRVNPLIDNIKLSRYKRNILKKRYTKLVVFYEKYADNIRWKYNTCRIIISVGSMILPTLQTIQNNESVSAYKTEIFWASIGTSLGVMISNNLISMFALDRRYIMYAITAEKLKSVGWKYFELSDMFSNKSHLENWILFWNEVEKIKKLQIVAEFTDNDDKQHEPSTTTIENTRDDTESEYDSDTPRIKQKHSHKNEDFYEDDTVINLEEERRKRIKKTNSTFNKNYNNSTDNSTDNLKDNSTDNSTDNLKDNLTNNLKDNLTNNLKNNLKDNLKDNLTNNLTNNLQDNLQDNLTDNKINSLVIEVDDNINVNVDNEKKNVEIVLDDLHNTIVKNLDIKKKN